jgi:hypothetical protein
MTTPDVCLHIGAMKTGTTYVQRMLGGNHEQLAQNGIIYPLPWSDQAEAVRDVLKMKGGSHLGSIDGRWALMAERLHQWSGPRAILSMEFLSFADTGQIRMIIDDLSPSRVTVVLGARDLGRVLPAQWQTAVRNGQRYPYHEYLKGVTAKRPTRTKLHFWKRQDIGRIANDWATVVGHENVTVVTVPPSGTDPGELWRRFATAMDLDSFALENRTVSNESLGLTGTELLRRINEHAEEIGMSTWSYQHGINRALSHQVLPNVVDPHPKLRVPDEYHDWVRRESQRVLSELREAQVRVVGDLTDLEPNLVGGSPFLWPEEVSDSELLAFAVSALTAFSSNVADVKRREIEGGKQRKARAKRREERGPGV